MKWSVAFHKEINYLICTANWFPHDMNHQAGKSQRLQETKKLKCPRANQVQLKLYEKHLSA